LRRSPAPPGLYALADADALAPRTLSETVRCLAEAGVRWVQIRAKNLPDRLLQAEVERSVEALESYDCHLWINDRADLAALYPVSGLHLGQDDLPPADARRVVGESVWLGASTHSVAQVRRAAADPEVDVIAVGPVFATTSKAMAGEPAGLELVRRARALTDKPLVAIGGIEVETAAEVLEAGADSVAVIGALCRGSLEANLRRWESLL
jgi:thiamine-phosphate pyrophosphorylase